MSTKFGQKSAMDLLREREDRIPDPRPPVVEPEWRARLHSAYIPHAPVDLINTEPSMAKQEFKDECDINVLMARYEKDGLPPGLTTATPSYIDCTEIPSLREAMDIFINAEAAFMSLSANVRKEFDNDPLKFVEYASDKANLPKMREWGLAPPEPEPDAPMRVEVVNAPAAPGAPGDAPKAS